MRVSGTRRLFFSQPPAISQAMPNGTWTAQSLTFMPIANEPDIEGRKVRVTNLHKVLYPNSGFTKA